MSFINKKYMERFYSKNYSLKKLSYWKVKRLYKIENKKMVDSFFHNLISDWIQNNYEETQEFISKLKKYIRKTKIILNDVEKDQLLILDERVFSNERNFKTLLVNIELKRGEFAGAKFTEAKIYKNNNFIQEGDLIFTNQKIIHDGKKIFTFPYENIQNIYKGVDGLKIDYKKNLYLLNIHDQPTLNNTFFSIYKKYYRQK